ncbi:hypothetical protein NST62_01630 [Ureibacillus sp. FSL K6-8385]|uniref:hypothetical protein n=1 Tax=Ureibacillus sp. FSL K6-8385 TaxID=2954684 RepID=UPI0031584F94
MMKKRRLRAFFISLSIIFVLAGCTQSGEESKNKDEQASASAEEKNVNLIGKVTLSKSSGRIGDEVAITAESLKPEKPLKVVWVDMEGSYQIEDNYSFIGAAYEPAEKVVAEGKADADGKWAGAFSIPDGFGDDHDILVYQDDEVVAKANFFVETVFTISPTSGPPGTEVTIKGEGLSWKMYGSLWHVNWDNKYTGMITAVTTNGKAVAVFRAAGKKGLHSITVESGASGFPYLSRDSSAINYIHTHYFTFEITSDEPVTTASYVEKAPEAADGGIQMPEPKNKDGVKVALDRPEGTVGEKVVLTASGLPKNEKVSFDWHTMVGTRVTKEGYGPEIFDLGEAETDDKGNLTYEFAIPDDLGGLPHLIDVKVGDEVYGQAYIVATGEPGYQFIDIDFSWADNSQSWALTISSWADRFSTRADTLPSWALASFSWANNSRSWALAPSSWADTFSSWALASSSWADNSQPWALTYSSWADESPTRADTLPSWALASSSWADHSQSWALTHSSWADTLPSWALAHPL